MIYIINFSSTSSEFSLIFFFRILEDAKNAIVYISGQTDQDLRAVCDLCLRQLWVLGEEDDVDLRYINPLFLRITLIPVCVRKLVTVPPVIICYPTVS